MIIAFLIITGTAFFFFNKLRMDIAESFVMSLFTMIVIINLTGLVLHNLLLGVIIYILLALFGILLTVRAWRNGELVEMGAVKRYMIVLFAVFLCSCLFCQGDHIRHIDEFHMWALAPKYMLEHNRLPINQDFVGSLEHHLGTCIFNYFFQRFSGYNEGMMYASTMFLAWIGLLLPLGNKKNNSWVRNLIYVLILFFSLSVLYIHGTRSAYVDIPTSGWIAGLSGWSIQKKKDLRNIILIPVTIITAYMFKGWAGLLLGCFFLFFLFIKKGYENQKSSDRMLPFMGIATALTVAFATALTIAFKTVDLQTYISEPVMAKLAPLGYSVTKAEKTIESMLLIVIGKPLNYSKGQMRVAFFEAFCISIAIIIFFGLINNCLKKSVALSLYTVIISSIYFCVLLVGHVFRMSYTFATTFWAGHRYLSIMAIYLVVFSISLILFDVGDTREQRKYSEYVALGVLLFFIYGVRTNFLCYYTPFNQERTSHYDTITGQKNEAEAIQELIGKDKKVYFLNQGAALTDEFETNPALYYLEDQISDYRKVPWQYSGDGGVINISSFSNYTLEGLPTLLSEGDYSYVWIHKTNDFLNDHLKNIIKISREGKRDQDSGEEEDIIDGQLYKVVYRDNEAVELKLVKNLKTYDKRSER